jgi:hypothetical protein
MTRKHKKNEPIEKEYVCFICGNNFISTRRFNKPSTMVCSSDCYHKKEYNRMSAYKLKIMTAGAIHEKTPQYNILYECKCNTKIKVYHHPDYSKFQDVVRLCNTCHQLEHKRLRSLQPALAEAI